MKDITGKTRGFLTAISCTNRKTRNGDYIWNFICSCGSRKTMSVGAFNSYVHPQCGDCGTKARVEKTKTHGMSRISSKVYKAWAKMRERCYNINCKNYKKYGGRGIKINPVFDDFLEFYKEIGEPPDCTSRWSIDRIDVNGDYTIGNIRWATDEQQARNKLKFSSNSSGHTGVQWDVKSKNNNTESLYAVATWREEVCGKTKQKKVSFSVKKYGLLPSFAMACVYRESKIKELIEKGYGYSESHGK